MSVIGVIMEINPFHNGHKYFLSQIDKQEDDILIAIISTTITQRGEISVLDKKTKAQLLLDNNVDIVIGLPSLFSNQGGYFYAYHNLRHLKMCNIDTLYFGSECADLQKLVTLSETYEQSSHEAGMHSKLETIGSNDILAISYIRAINDLQMNVDIKLVKRIVNNYNDSQITGTISSATSIRNNIENIDMIKDSLPAKSLENILTIDHAQVYKIFQNNLLIFKDDKPIFLSENNEILRKMYKYIDEPYDNFIHKCSDKNNSKHKLNRIIINTILNVTEADYDSGIKYLHVLGFTSTGQQYIKQLDVVTSLKNQENYCATIEQRASNLLKIVSNYGKNADFEQPVIRRNK